MVPDDRFSEDSDTSPVPTVRIGRYRDRVGDDLDRLAATPHSIPDTYPYPSS